MIESAHDRAVEMYSYHFLVMDTDKVRKHFADHPDLEAFWVGVAEAAMEEQAKEVSNAGKDL